MNQYIELSLEQEFSLRSFTDKCKHISREQAQELLIMLYKQMMIRETMYQQILKHEWKLELDAVSG